MIWYDYIRGFADGQQDRESNNKAHFNLLLTLLRLISAVLFFALTVCYAVLKGLTGLVGLMILIVTPKRR